MTCRSDPEDLLSLYRRWPAGAGGATAGGPIRDKSFALFELHKKCMEEEELAAKSEERKQTLKSLQQRTDELQEKVKKEEALYLSFDNFLKEEATEKAERGSREALQLEAQLERLKLEYADVMERKQKLQRHMERRRLYWDFMVQVVKMTKFDDVQALAGHLENLLHFRGHLYQKLCEAQQQLNQQRKATQTMEDKHLRLRLHTNNRLSQIQTELEETRSESLILEDKWNHIEETAAKKTLLLGQIKMATLNLYEEAGYKVDGEEDVDMNDTVKQLDKVKTFISDHRDIVKQHQASSQKKDKTKAKKSFTA